MKYSAGKVAKGTVTGIEAYGIFISLDEYYSGLIHISEISHNYVKNINNYVEIGDNIYVEILEIDEETGHLKLSIKNIDYKVRKKNYGKKIEETAKGFTTLSYKLPFWIDENLKKDNFS